MNRLFSLFYFFLLRIFCQKIIFASGNLEITMQFVKCEAIIRTLNCKLRKGDRFQIKEINIIITLQREINVKQMTRPELTLNVV